MKIFRRYSLHKLPAEHRDTCKEWIRSLAGSTNDISINFAITRDENGHQLHLTEYLRNEAGRRFLDVASGNPVTRPLVFPVDPGTWPAFINDTRSTSCTCPDVDDSCPRHGTSEETPQ